MYSEAVLFESYFRPGKLLSSRRHRHPGSLVPDCKHLSHRWKCFFRPFRARIFPLSPTACAVGCSLAPLRGYV